MRRQLLIHAAAVLVASLAAAPGAAARLSFRNPLRGPAGRALSCPDPSVIDVPRGKLRYVMVCTSDKAENAFPIWKSSDLVRWQRSGSVFRGRGHPWWALAPGPAGGKYWGPEINRIAGRWVIYFAASYDRSKLDLRLPDGSRVAPRTHVIGVASATSLAGPWRTRLLHFRGQYNGVNPEQERYGGAIDPSMVRDPRSGRLYLFWADQSNEIWVGELSADGLKMQPQIRLALTQDEAWECDEQNKACTLEGPEPFYRDGLFYLLYSGANTWDASYAVGVAASAEPMDPSHPFVELGRPILIRGRRFIGPGHSSHPIVGPDGNSYVLYHAQTRPSPDHISSNRLLMLGRVSWVGGWPLINNGVAG